MSAVAAYGRVFQRVSALRLTHPQLYTCHGNRAAALLKLGMFDEALLDAERCRLLAHESFKKCVSTENYPTKSLDPDLNPN